MKASIAEVMEALNEMREDPTLPKNVRLKLECMNNVLSQDIEQSIKISRALHEVEELSDDCNLESFTRTQIFNIMSMLETVE